MLPDAVPTSGMVRSIQLISPPGSVSTIGLTKSSVTKTSSKAVHPLVVSVTSNMYVPPASISTSSLFCPLTIFPSTVLQSYTKSIPELEADPSSSIVGDQQPSNASVPASASGLT